MTTILFDGRTFAKQKEEALKLQVRNLSKRGIVPKLDSIIVGSDPASILYQNLKKKAAERIGADVRIKVYPESISVEELVGEIKKLNDYPSVNGIMVQLPLPKKFSNEDRDEILGTIAPEKDVDGLREDSKFTAPTAKAVVEVLKVAIKPFSVDRFPLTVCVVGASGMEGKKIVEALNSDKRLKELVNSLRIIQVNSKTSDLGLKTKDCDVVISVTGVPDLIKADMIKPGAILIDVGSPKGDIEKAAYDKASFVSPVPGGVGPITISSLLENLIIETTKVN